MHIFHKGQQLCTVAHSESCPVCHWTGRREPTMWKASQAWLTTTRSPQTAGLHTCHGEVLSGLAMHSLLLVRQCARRPLPAQLPVSCSSMRQRPAPVCGRCDHRQTARHLAAAAQHGRALSRQTRPQHPLLHSPLPQWLPHMALVAHLYLHACVRQKIESLGQKWMSLQYSPAEKRLTLVALQLQNGSQEPCGHSLEDLSRVRLAFAGGSQPSNGCSGTLSPVSGAAALESRDIMCHFSR